jgi:hypothetical protein
MSIWRQLVRGLRALTNRRAADQDIADEISSYLEQAAAALEARGISPDEARRAARLEIGSATAVREQVRSYGWENAIRTPLSDLCYAARRLRRNPGFTTVCVLTLAFGIGANSAIFSVINGVILKPLGYLHPDELIDRLRVSIPSRAAVRSVGACPLPSGSHWGSIVLPSSRSLETVPLSIRLKRSGPPYQKLPVTFIVINNREYNVLKNFIRSQASYASIRANRFVAMDLVDPPIDFLALAKSMGVPARRLNTAADIAPAIEAAIASGGPIILEIPIA